MLSAEAYQEARRLHGTFGEFFGHTVGRILAGDSQKKLQVKRRAGLGALVVQAGLDVVGIREVTTLSEAEGDGLVTVGYLHDHGVRHSAAPRVWQRPCRDDLGIEASNAFGALSAVDVSVEWDDDSRDQRELTTSLLGMAAAGPEEDALHNLGVFGRYVLPLVGQRVEGPLTTYDPILRAELRQQVARFY
jgi:hypothetical protein